LLMGFIWLRVLVNPVCFFILYLMWEACWATACCTRSHFWGLDNKGTISLFLAAKHFLSSSTSEASLGFCSVHAKGKAAKPRSDPLISCLVPVLRMCGSVCAAHPRLYIFIVMLDDPRRQLYLM